MLGCTVFTMTSIFLCCRGQVIALSSSGAAVGSGWGMVWRCAATLRYKSECMYALSFSADTSLLLSCSRADTQSPLLLQCWSTAR